MRLARWIKQGKLGPHFKQIKPNPVPTLDFNCGLLFELTYDHQILQNIIIYLISWTDLFEFFLYSLSEFWGESLLNTYVVL